MRRALLIGMAVTLLAALAVGGTASALHLQVGKLLVDANAKIEPSGLPGKRNAPVEVTSTVRVSTSDGSAPAGLRRLVLQFDKHGSINPSDFPKCTLAKLQGKTSDAARAACPKAVVGEGIARAVVTMPGQAPFTISSPLIFFNAPPTGGQPTMIVHAYEKVPEPKALLVPLVVERVNKGRYGYQIDVEMPEIAGGYGAATLSKATIGATLKRGGNTVGFVNAHCEGGRLQVFGIVYFGGGEGFTNGTLVQPCHAEG
jgi:hypothetical protein